MVKLYISGAGENMVIKVNDVVQENFISSNKSSDLSLSALYAVN